jgi:PHP family Zn ribbon phosphoesterase
VEEIVKDIHSLQGLAIAAHIDRESFSLIGQLGFVPADLPLDALEISPGISHDEAVRRYAPSLPLVQSSDAHKEEEIGRCRTVFLVEEASIEEIIKALEEKAGRRIAG